VSGPSIPLNEQEGACAEADADFSVHIVRTLHSRIPEAPIPAEPGNEGEREVRNGIVDALDPLPDGHLLAATLATTAPETQNSRQLDLAG